MAAAEMARYATEQPSVATDSSLTAQNADVEMAANATEHRLQVISAGPTGSPGPWEIHVAFNNGMWWAMPRDLSDSILKELCFGTF